MALPNLVDRVRALYRQPSQIEVRVGQRVEEVISTDQAYRAKMLAFIQLISEITGHGRPPATDLAVSTSSTDLRNDLLIKSIRDSAQDLGSLMMHGLRDRVAESE